ncbi:MAG: histone deacetylase [Pseudomonadota bacterium]
MRPQFFYPDTPQLPLPDGHRFPAQKYALLRQRLLADGVLRDGDLHASPLATRDELTAAHDPAYVDAIADGSVDPAIMADIGLPWSPVLARRSRATVGGTLAAARAALSSASGVSGQLAGGTHHAHAARGAGFCTFNDFAVAAEVLLREGAIDRVAIIDVDVHQGDGNATLLAANPAVFVASLHGANNYPFDKPLSDLDIALPDGTEDRAYSHALCDALNEIGAFRPDLLLMNAGVDPLEQDRLGRLALTFDGLYERDRLILHFAERRGIPLVIAIGGGYARPIDLTVTAYANTFRAARDVFRF